MCLDDHNLHELMHPIHQLCTDLYQPLPFFRSEDPVIACEALTEQLDLEFAELNLRVPAEDQAVSKRMEIFEQVIEPFLDVHCCSCHDADPGNT